MVLFIFWLCHYNLQEVGMGAEVSGAVMQCWVEPSRTLPFSFIIRDKRKEAQECLFTKRVLNKYILRFDE